MQLKCQLKSVAIIGSGTMGRGIAQWFAQAGVTVSLYDISQENTRQAEKQLKTSWDKLVKRGKFSQNEVDRFQQNLHIGEPPAKNCDLLIEAVVENLETKIKLFQHYLPSLKDDCFLATNTSSLSIDSIAKHLPSKRRSFFLGIHFFNPAQVMKLVEIVMGQESNPQLCHGLYDWFASKNKRPALCRDSPGFIVNRVARNFYGEALQIAGDHDVDKLKEIDRVMREVGGFRMGPFELMDLIGIDVNYTVTCSVWEAFDRHPRFAPHPLQKKMVEVGKLGKKTNGGFF